jgi:thioredoxin-related protein
LKRLILVTALALAGIVFWNHLSASDKENLQWVSFDEGIVEARKNNKKLLVDVYTNWCGWCKKMDENTYSDPAVGAYLKKHYVVVKLNAESEKSLRYKDVRYTEREFAGAFGIKGFPSTIFLKSSGEPITIFPGYADATMFQNVISFIAEDHYLRMEFDEYLSTKK